VSIPSEVVGNRLDAVVLEFAVEATASSEADSVATPEVGVFPLTQAFNDGPETPMFEDAVPSVRPVALGANRVVRMDITDIVRGWMNQPSSNHGLVVGSLTGPEVGTVTLKETIPDSEAAIRVTFYYQNRHGEAMSSRQQD
jgi:hypothetical protein